MDIPWRNFLLVSAFAAVVTPVFGQTVAPTAGQASSGNEGAESIPDFSGFWVHPLPGFEPLPSRGERQQRRRDSRYLEASQNLNVCLSAPAQGKGVSTLRTVA
jgi:hypothetical protein